MGLSAKETKILESLLKKKDEPDPPSVGKTINVSIDLGNPQQVKLAQQHGFLDMLDEDDETEETEEETEGDEKPNRRGYFKD